jgi:CRP/FNR family transcriptional regulator
MDSTVIDISSVRSVCQQCGIYKLCMPMGLEKGDLDQLDAIIKRRRPLAKGEHLYRAGDNFNAIYALRSGSLKTFITHSNGEEQVMGFKLPGDLLGLSAINGDHYTTSARALETSSVCEIPFQRLEDLCTHIPGLQHHILGMMSKEIQEEHDKVALCTKMPAEGRLASVLLTLSERFQRRGYSATEFNLSMSRSDIANMLGMAVETVSRLFTQFQDSGLVEVNRKHIILKDREKLSKLVRFS